MANADTPFGAKPVKHLNGMPWNGKFNIYYKEDAEDLFIGSIVASGGTADATGKYPTVKLATTTPPRGIVVGFSTSPNIVADPANLARVYSPSTETGVYVAVADDPNIIFEMQEDSSTALTITEVGLNFSPTSESGNTTTGKSTIEIDCSTELTTSTLSMKLLRVVDRPDNALGTNCKWECMFNAHELGQGLGSTAI